MRAATIVVLAVAALSGCGGGEDDADSSPTALARAHDACSAGLADAMEAEFDEPLEVSDAMRLSEGDTVLEISIENGLGDVVAGVLFDATRCVLEETGAPSSLLETFDATTPSGGRSGEYDDIELTWYLGDQSYNRIYTAEFQEG